MDNQQDRYSLGVPQRKELHGGGDFYSGHHNVAKGFRGAHRKAKTQALLVNQVFRSNRWKQVHSDLERTNLFIVLKVFVYRLLHFADCCANALLTKFQFHNGIIRPLEGACTARFKAPAAVNTFTLAHQRLT